MDPWYVTAVFAGKVCMCVPGDLLRGEGPHVSWFSKGSGTHKVRDYGNKEWGDAF